MPGGHKNIRGTDGNTFSSTNQPKNRGRKKLLTNMAKEKGYSAHEVVLVMAHVLTLTRDERKKAYRDNPDGLEAAVIKAVEKSISSGDWGKIQNIVEHIAGKATQRHEVNEGKLTIKIVRE